MQGADIWMMIAFTILALIGGVVREIQGIDRTHFNALAFAGGVLVSAFTGIVVFFICKYFATDTWLTGALTAVAGYGGTTALDFVTSAIKNRIATKETKTE